jgi:hypothetical protein
MLKSPVELNAERNLLFLPLQGGGRRGSAPYLETKTPCPARLL